MPYETIRWTEHGKQRVARRGIRMADVHRVLGEGELIRTYPDDRPRPSYLVLGWVEGRPLHVVAADDPGVPETVIITAYVPDAELWESDFRRRKP